MGEGMTDALPAILAAGLCCLAGAGLGLAIGTFGRAVLGMLVAGLLIAALIGMIDPYAALFSRCVASVPISALRLFLAGAGGIAVLAGFLGGLAIASRRTR